MPDRDDALDQAIRETAPILADALLTAAVPGIPGSRLTWWRQRALMSLLVNSVRTEEKMDETQIREQIEGLRYMTTGQLKEKYREVFGEESRSNHKQFLFRRVAWRIQANAWGGLSERARLRALEIADDADLRIRAPKNFLREGLDASRTVETRVDAASDPRLPLPGTMLVRQLPRQGRRGEDPEGGLRTRRQNLQIAQQGGHGSHWHSLEWLRFFWQ